jgi:putative addiction module CopG family antidote
MAIALADEQQRFIARMVRIGRFNNQSEVVREALRRMAAAETEYLTPAPLTAAQTARIYGGRNSAREDAFGKAAFAAMRRAAANGRRP